jgi:FtsH-binding integral membrane protein
MTAAELQANTPYARFGTFAIDAPVDARRTFIRKTYMHLAMAIYAFVALEWLFFSIGLHEPFMQMLAGQPMYWLGVMLAFVAVNWVFSGREIGVIPAAGVTTLVMFAGLTAVAFFTKQDFSFLRGILGIATFAAIALIVVSMLFGFHLGIWFSAAMVIAACGYILYDTSNIIHHYRTDQYVAAALALFASVALLFWYVLRIFIALSNRD